MHEPTHTGDASAAGGSEVVFAAWLARREQGGAVDFGTLLADHPLERAGLERLHRAWTLLCGAIGPPDGSSASSRAFPADDPALFAGRYRKERLLGRGGQGEVWLAEDHRLGRRVALKILAHPDPERMRRFEREAAVTSRLDHPGICPVFESGEVQGAAYIAMRFVEGESLAQWIEQARERWATHRGSRSRPGTLTSGLPQAADVERAVRLVIGAARALHAAHEAGVVHRDVKPGNILVTKDEQPVLVDFGFAADTGGAWSTITRSSQFPGTPAYMSPEQIIAKEHLRPDRRTDVWSLGVTLYECLTGKRPFERPTWHAVFRAIVEDEPLGARVLHPGLSADLEVILATALEKGRERRYPSAAALADDLESWLAGRPIAARKITWAGRLSRWAHREPLLAVLLGALALALPILGALASYALLTRQTVRAGEVATREQALERLLVEAYAQSGDGDRAGAVATFQQARALDAGCIEAEFGRMHALFSLGRLEEARAIDRRGWTDVGGTAWGQWLDHALTSGSDPAGTSDQELLDMPEPTTPMGHFLAGSMLSEQALGRMRTLVGGSQALLSHGVPSAGRELLERAAEHLWSAILLSRSPRALYYHQYARVLRLLDAPREQLEDLANAMVAHWPDTSWGRLDIGRGLPSSDPARELER